MRITASRLRAIQTDRTGLVTLTQAAVFLGRRSSQVLALCERGLLPLSRAASGEVFFISEKYTIEVAALRRVLSPEEARALDLWVTGVFDTPEAAVTAVRSGTVIARPERIRERSAAQGALS